MYNWWIARSTRVLRLQFFRRLLLLLLEPLGPGRHDPVHASVGDGLAEMFAKVTGDGDEGTTQGGLAIEHFLRLVGISVVEGDDGIAEMREGIFHSLEDFRFVTREARDGLEIDVCRWGGAQCPGNAIICRRNVGEDFADRANALGGTPSVFLDRHGFGKARVALLVVGDLF